LKFSLGWFFSLLLLTNNVYMLTSIFIYVLEILMTRVEIA